MPRKPASPVQRALHRCAPLCERSAHVARASLVMRARGAGGALRCGVASRTRSGRVVYFWFFGFSLALPQLAAAAEKASLCSNFGFAFLTLAISDFMKML